MRTLVLFTAVLSFCGCAKQLVNPTAEHSKTNNSGDYRLVGNTVYCWYVQQVGGQLAGYMLHDGSTGYIPACAGNPYRTLKDVGDRLKKMGATYIELVPNFPSSPEVGWKTRPLTNEEQILLALEIPIIKIKDR